MREAIELKDPTPMYFTQPLEVKCCTYSDGISCTILRFPWPPPSVGQLVRVALHYIGSKGFGVWGGTLPWSDHPSNGIPHEASQYHHAHCEPVSLIVNWRVSFPGQNENLGLRLLNNSALTYTEVNYSGKSDKVHCVRYNLYNGIKSHSNTCPFLIHVLYLTSLWMATSI